MNWGAISARFERVRAGDTDLQKKIRGLRRRLALLLAVVGPGLITSNVDNDAGGISVYTQAGAKYGYALLWSRLCLARASADPPRARTPHCREVTKPARSSPYRVIS